METPALMAIIQAFGAACLSASAQPAPHFNSLPSLDAGGTFNIHQHSDEGFKSLSVYCWHAFIEITYTFHLLKSTQLLLFTPHLLLDSTPCCSYFYLLGSRLCSYYNATSIQFQGKFAKERCKVQNRFRNFPFLWKPSLEFPQCHSHKRLRQDILHRLTTIC